MEVGERGSECERERKRERERASVRKLRKIYSMHIPRGIVPVSVCSDTV